MYNYPDDCAACQACGRPTQYAVKCECNDPELEECSECELLFKFYDLDEDSRCRKCRIKETTPDDES